MGLGSLCWWTLSLYVFIRSQRPKSNIRKARARRQRYKSDAISTTTLADDDAPPLSTLLKIFASSLSLRLRIYIYIYIRLSGLSVVGSVFAAQPFVVRRPHTTPLMHTHTIYLGGGCKPASPSVQKCWVQIFSAGISNSTHREREHPFDEFHSRQSSIFYIDRYPHSRISLSLCVEPTDRIPQCKFSTPLSVLLICIFHNDFYRRKNRGRTTLMLPNSLRAEEKIRNGGSV